MVRTCSVDKNGMKKGTWTREEDGKLKAYIERYGHWNWRQLPKFAGLARCGKSCRLRWMNYLRPGVKQGNYTKEEDDLIIKLHEKLGNRWSAIASKLPGRSDNEVKNYWHTYLKKRLKKVQQTKENPIGLSTQASQSSKVPSHQQEDQRPHDQISQVELSSSVESPSIESSAILSDLIESFWNEPFVLDTSYNTPCHSSFFDVGEGFISFSPYLNDSADFGLSMD